jgi:thiosulfate dehydrogenase [quinone] large subunit
MNNYTKVQLWVLVLLRVTIGWHFLYEGLVKLANPNWSSVSYLTDSEGIFSGIFHFMASSPGLVDVIDLMNVWGLIAIGLGLITGTLSRIALAGGIVLLGFYYISHPPFVGLKYSMPMEGSYLIVNKVLIELFAMIVLFLFPTSREIGMDRFILGTKEK